MPPEDCRVPRSTVPLSRPSKDVAASRARRAASRVARASTRKAAPGAVSVMRSRYRSIRVTPRSRSSLAMALDTADCTT